MKVCTWQDPVVLRSFSLRTIKQPFEFLRVGGHRRLGTLTKPKDWTCHGCRNNSNESISNLSMLLHRFKRQTSSPSLLPTPRSGNQLCDWWVFHHSPFRGRSNKRWKPAQGNLHLQQCRDLSNAQGNLLALQWHLIAGYLSNFVVDLIQSLVIVQGNIQKIVTSSDVRKREMLRLDQTEWTFEMKLFEQLRVQLHNRVLFWFGSAFLALVAQHGHMWTCNTNQPNSKLNITDMFLRRYGHQWSILLTLFVIWVQRLRLNGQPIVSIGSLTELRSFVGNINSSESHLMDAWLVLSTKKVNLLRNHGLFKLIVIQLSLLLMDCHVMVVITTFKGEVMTWKKLNHIHIRWRTWSIELSLQRTAQNLNWRPPLHSALLRLQHHPLQWLITVVFHKARSKRQITPLLRKLLGFDPGNRSPLRKMWLWGLMERRGMHWLGAFLAPSRSVVSWTKPMSFRIWLHSWVRLTIRCWPRAIFVTLARKTRSSSTAFPASHSEAWYAQGNLRPISSLPEILRWHLWTWSTGTLPRAGTSASTSRRSRTSSHQAADRSGTISNGVVGCLTLSRASSTLLNVCSGGEPLAQLSLSSLTLATISLGTTAFSTVIGSTRRWRVTHRSAGTQQTISWRKGSIPISPLWTTSWSWRLVPTLGTTSLSCPGTAEVTGCTPTSTVKWFEKPRRWGNADSASSMPRRSSNVRRDMTDSTWRIRSTTASNAFDSTLRQAL